jgi:hypothetical protein
MGFESLRRHPISGIFLLRKRVPERLKETVGKGEVKLSLGTRDPAIARIRHLEELAKIERAWSGIDATINDGEGRVLAHLQCKFSPDALPADAAATNADPPRAEPTAPTAVAATSKASVPLRRLFKSYAKEAQLAPSTVKRWSSIG